MQKNVARYAKCALAALGLVMAASAQAGSDEGSGDAAIPAWVYNFTFKGDLRYRNETIDQQWLDRRNRDRVRLRAGFTAKVNDTVTAEMGLATSEGNDPRSSNVTLGRANSRKDIFLDLAFVQWQALPSLKLMAGKMKFPWQRPGASTLFDSDINPEGLAATWAHGDFFGSAFHHYLDERSNASESTLQGGQFGWKPAVGGGKLTLAAGLFDFHRVRGRDPFHAGNAYGNTTTAVGCEGGAASCLTQDYNLIEAFAEYSRPVGGRPLALFAHSLTNEAADDGMDSAWSAGVSWGRAAEAGQWEVGYTHQRIRKDAVFGQFIDSDVGGGNTDHRAHVLRAGYAVAKNWTVNAAYQMAETDLDVPVLVDGTLRHGRNYQRLQLDLNFRF